MHGVQAQAHYGEAQHDASAHDIDASMMHTHGLLAVGLGLVLGLLLARAQAQSTLPSRDPFIPTQGAGLGSGYGYGSGYGTCMHA